jgi:hypothetical protein
MGEQAVKSRGAADGDLNLYNRYEYNKEGFVCRKYFRISNFGDGAAA